MTWEETIRFIRLQKEYANLIEDCYLGDDHALNVQKFSNSVEFAETLKLIAKRDRPARILDVGCGTGITSISFALRGFEVVASDPDPSSLVGTGAVRQLKEKLKLNNLEVITSTAEELKLDQETFDVVYCRQALHHARELRQFVQNCARFLKPEGQFITIRDHVIYDSEEKKRFLSEHPLHKFYGGENAYRSTEYKDAFATAGLEVRTELKFFDSIINHYPLTIESIQERIQQENALIRKTLKGRLGPFGDNRIANILYKFLFFNPDKMWREEFYAGRMYSYICIKK